MKLAALLLVICCAPATRELDRLLLAGLAGLVLLLGAAVWIWRHRQQRHKRFS